LEVLIAEVDHEDSSTLTKDAFPAGKRKFFLRDASAAQLALASDSLGRAAHQSGHGHCTALAGFERRRIHGGGTV